MNVAGDRQILVVDDDASLRNMITRALERQRFNVSSVANGEEAVALFQRNGAQIGLVVLDMAMPGLNGAQTLQALRKLHPELPVLLMSGFFDRATVENLLAGAQCDFIQKPFTFVALREKVHQMLGPSPCRDSLVAEPIAQPV
jgi:DNA-binding NtrC family response regulator